MLDKLGGSDPRRRKALGGCQAAQSGVATAQNLFSPAPIPMPRRRSCCSFFATSSGAQRKSGRDSKRKATSREFPAPEASFFTAFKSSLVASIPSIA